MAERSKSHLPREDYHFVTMLYKSLDESLTDLAHTSSNGNDSHD
jgi:hypothetical protein